MTKEKETLLLTSARQIRWYRGVSVSHQKQFKYLTLCRLSGLLSYHRRKDNIRHPTREMLGKYSISEKGAEIWHIKFSNLHKIRKT